MKALQPITTTEIVLPKHLFQPRFHHDPIVPRADAGPPVLLGVTSDLPFRVQQKKTTEKKYYHHTNRQLRTVPIGLEVLPHLARMTP
jgi:hypothetical protein